MTTYYGVVLFGPENGEQRVSDGPSLVVQNIKSDIQSMLVSKPGALESVKVEVNTTEYTHRSVSVGGAVTNVWAPRDIPDASLLLYLIEFAIAGVQ